MKENQKAIDREIDSYINEDASISKNYDLLTSIPGIGRIIALETIVLTGKLHCYQQSSQICLLHRNCSIQKGVRNLCKKENDRFQERLF